MLSIRGLVKVYPGPVAALQGVDLDVPVGMFGLLGPNGAGKSTLMRILAGLLEPTSGSVHMDGQDVLADPALVRRTLGYLPQDFGFYPHLTGEQMLRHLLVLKGVSAPQGLKSLTAELLERVNLGFAGRRTVKSYSGGMRQRLGIAQAIAGDPRLVIVDEPTAGLDPEERLRFYHLLTELAEQRTVLLSTHIVDDVAVLCPQFAVIRGGRLVARTTPRAARAALQGRIFEGVVAPADLPALRASRAVTQTLLMEGRHRVRLYEPDGAAPAGFEKVEPSLEDAYLVLMRLGELPGTEVVDATAQPRNGDGSPRTPDGLVQEARGSERLPTQRLPEAHFQKVAP
jgi:ABC-type multidrug transport system ATPase subunit